MDIGLLVWEVGTDEVREMVNMDGCWWDMCWKKKGELRVLKLV